MYWFEFMMITNHNQREQNSFVIADAIDFRSALLLQRSRPRQKEEAQQQRAGRSFAQISAMDLTNTPRANEQHLTRFLLSPSAGAATGAHAGASAKILGLSMRQHPRYDVQTLAVLMEHANNKASSVYSTSTDTDYPTAMEMREDVRLRAAISDHCRRTSSMSSPSLPALIQNAAAATASGSGGHSHLDSRVRSLLSSRANTDPYTYHTKVQDTRSQTLTDLLLAPAASSFVASQQQRLLSASTNVPGDFDRYYNSILQNAGHGAPRSSEISAPSTQDRYYDVSYAAALLGSRRARLLGATAAMYAPDSAVRFSRSAPLQEHDASAAALEASLRAGGFDRFSSTFASTGPVATNDDALKHRSICNGLDPRSRITDIATSSRNTGTATESLARTTLMMDLANATNMSKTPRIKPHSNGYRAFPAVLHKALLAMEDTVQGYEIALFLPGGKAFAIRNQFLFEQRVLPIFFPKMKNFASFQRQLNLYDFKRIEGRGICRGTYRHDMFVRECPMLANLMRRTKIKGVQYHGKAPGAKKEAQP